MQPYNFILIEKKWQQIWKVQKETLQYKTAKHAPKYYILNRLPDVSGRALHLGHYMGYIASDILARYYKQKGYHVMNPIGFDGMHREKYIEQLQQVGLAVDGASAINTSEPTYYKWTQWIFLQLFHAWYNQATQKAEPIATLIEAFAKEGNSNINGASDLYTPIFSAEEWSSYSPSAQQEKLLHYRLAYLKEGVVRLRITAYAKRLIEEVEKLDWPLSTKAMQRNGMGFSPGAEITFRIQGQSSQSITIFTTRPETIFGACFIAIAPEHYWASYIAAQTGDPTLLDYINQAKNKKDRGDMLTPSSVSGIFANSCVIHPFTGAPLPIWIVDYVLPNYGTAAIMGVPAHRSQDYVFAQFFELLSVPVIASELLLEEGPYEKREGVMINSRFLNGLSPEMAAERIMHELIKRNIGKHVIYDKLSDPVLGGPLVLSEGRHQMPAWAAASWYFLRQMDPHNAKVFVGKPQATYWQAVDHYLYIGGAEETTAHLIYARFLTKVLYDLGHIATQEPFLKLFYQNMIQDESAWYNYNVINLDSVIAQYGADALRLYLLCLAPLEEAKPWDWAGIESCYGFLNRVWAFVQDAKHGWGTTSAVDQAAAYAIIDQMIKKVSAAIEKSSFSRAINSLMKGFNKLSVHKNVEKAIVTRFILLLEPFAPHIAAELWEGIGNK
ncbi:MAG: class I tRNA ligase family protein [Amoebophilaceae bacterium]|nr:class I tRNA ligase family protein [Amoebophilaceae bacterium]